MATPSPSPAEDGVPAPADERVARADTEYFYAPEDEEDGEHEATVGAPDGNSVASNAHPPLVPAMGHQTSINERLWGEPLHVRGAPGLATQAPDVDEAPTNEAQEAAWVPPPTQLVVPRPSRVVDGVPQRVRKDSYVMKTPGRHLPSSSRTDRTVDGGSVVDVASDDDTMMIDLPTNREAEEQKKVPQFASLPTGPIRDQPVPGGPDFTYEVTVFQRRIFEDAWRVPKIVRQNEAQMARFGFLIGGAEGTVFHSAFLWGQLLLCMVIAAGTLVIVYFYLVLYGKYKTYVWAERDIIQAFEDLIELKTVASLTDNFVDLAAFLLGMYLDKMVDIWWELRHGTMQEMINIVSSQCMRAAVYFPHKTPTSRANKELLLRYGTLSLALFWRDAHEIDAWDVRTRKKFHLDDLDDLVAEGLLTKDEQLLLRDCPVKSQVIWTWIGSLWTKWILDGRLPDASHDLQSELLSECEEAANRIRSMLARINTQFPLTVRSMRASAGADRMCTRSICR